MDERDDAFISAGVAKAQPDILFNCAGFVHAGTMMDSTDEEWEFGMDLNVRSMYRTSKAAIPHMIQKGGAEVVNMRPPSYLIKKGITTLACIGDGRQSGTSASPSILNASPEAADGGGLALIQTGDRVRVDLNKGTANMLVDDETLKARAEALMAKGGFAHPDSQTPWQQIFRQTVSPFSEGMVIKGAPEYQSIHKTKGLPRDNH